MVATLCREAYELPEIIAERAAAAVADLFTRNCLWELVWDRYWAGAMLVGVGAGAAVLGRPGPWPLQGVFILLVLFYFVFVDQHVVKHVFHYFLFSFGNCKIVFKKPNPKPYPLTLRTINPKPSPLNT